MFHVGLVIGPVDFSQLTSSSLKDEIGAAKSAQLEDSGLKLSLGLNSPIDQSPSDGDDSPPMSTSVTDAEDEKEPPTWSKRNYSYRYYQATLTADEVMKTTKCCKSDCLHSLFNVQLIEEERTKLNNLIYDKLDPQSRVRVAKFNPKFDKFKNQVILDKLHYGRIKLNEVAIHQTFHLSSQQVCMKAFGMILMVSRNRLRRLVNICRDSKLE